VSDRFHHLFICPEDFNRSLAFYRDVLGWDVTYTGG
jgi:catechol 2,3-dioxygenase-like lactoylglutathione lyase family enzyme